MSSSRNRKPAVGIRYSLVSVGYGFHLIAPPLGVA